MNGKEENNSYRKAEIPMQGLCAFIRLAFSKALDGHLILCRCKLDKKTDYGKWCKFLNDPQCDNFKMRK